MKGNLIDIKSESFSWQVKLIGIVLLVAALAMINSYWWLSIIFAVAGLTLLTRYSGTEIDAVSKTFREYDSYFFVRTGTTEKYDRIERIFINDEMVTTHTSHPSRLYFFRYAVYNAYLKFADGRKIFLTSRKDKVKLIKLLDPVVTALSVDLIDNTVSG